MRPDSDAREQEIDDVRKPHLDPSQPTYDPAHDAAYDPEAPRTEAEVVEASEPEPDAAPERQSSDVDDTLDSGADVETEAERADTQTDTDGEETRAETDRAMGTASVPDVVAPDYDRVDQVDVVPDDTTPASAAEAAAVAPPDAYVAEPGPAQPRPTATDLEPGPAEPVPAGAEQLPPEVDLAAPAESPPAQITTERMPGEVPVEPLSTLWTDESAPQGFRDRWRDVQLRFVDDPRAAADEAQTLLAEVVDRLTAAVEQRKHDLDSWRSAEGGDTEELRVVVRRYRDLMDRLLGR